MATEVIPIPLADPPTDLQTIAQIEDALIFPSFTADTAWVLGNMLRTRLLTIPQPAVISIALANGPQQLFYSATRPGTLPDNDIWVARKRKTVLRFGKSTWYMHNKLSGDEALFAAKFQLGNSAGEYAIHGGGFPVRVKGVEGVVAAVIVSGLKMQDDHQVIVETITDYLQGIDELSMEPEKKKED